MLLSPAGRRETVYYRGRPVFRALGSVGLGDVGDLLAYRQEWEPFIAAHLALWRHLNELYENTPTAQQGGCPPGVFGPSQIKSTDPTTRVICESLSLTRARVSNTDPGGILKQWNVWKDKSSADILAGAPAMLAWHQEVVMRVGGQYKDELISLGKIWGIEIPLPALPSFSTQQEIRARIEGAYIATKGVIQILGYGVGETLGMAADVAQAVTQGLKDTAKEIPKTTRWIGVTAAVAAVVVGGALIVYYVPRRSKERA